MHEQRVLINKIWIIKEQESIFLIKTLDKGKDKNEIKILLYSIILHLHI